MKLVGLLPLSRIVVFALSLSLLAISAKPAILQRAAPLSISGSGFHIGRLESGAKAFSNRPYVWVNVPEAFSGWDITEIKGGKAADLTIRALTDTDVYIATNQPAPEGWQSVDGGVFAYNDKNGTTMHIYGRHVYGQTVLPVPQNGWAGTLVLAPALSGIANPPAVEERGAIVVQPGVPPPAAYSAWIKRLSKNGNVSHQGRWRGQNIWRIPISR